MPRIVALAASRWRQARAGAAGIIALLLAGCTVGPNYVRPTTDVPADYKESANFKAAQPSDDAAKGKWWEVYGDPQLNALEEQVSVSNQTLKEAQAQFVIARATIRVVRAAYYPTVTGRRVCSRYARIAEPSPVRHYLAHNLRRLSIAAH